MNEQIIHLVIDPHDRDTSFEKYLKDNELKYHFVSSFEEFKGFFFSKVDDIEIHNQKIMIWIHPQLGETNQENKSPSLKSASIKSKFEHDPQISGKFFYKELSRIPANLQTDDRISLIHGIFPFLKENSDKIQNFQTIFQTLFSKSEKNILKLLDRTPNQLENKVDVLIISALQLEFQSFYKINFFEKKQQKDEFGSRTNQIQTERGGIITVKGYAIDNSGMVDAAICTSKLIKIYKPKYVVMNGVCGGNPEKKKSDEKPNGIWFCDIVIPNKVFTFQKGKVTDHGFEKEIEFIELDKIEDSIIGDIKDMCETTSGESSLQQIVHNIDKSRYDENGISKINVLFDPMACGTAVISKDRFFTEEVKPEDRNAIALDMESYAVIRACQEFKTTGIIIKSIMDFTLNKEDKYKHLACDTSARMTELVIKRVLKFD